MDYISDFSPADITTPGTATYYYRVRNNITGCVSDEASQSVTVFERPGTPVITGDGTVCDSATLVATSTPTGIMYYYGINTGNIPVGILNSDTFTRVEGTHYFRADNGGCLSAFNANPDGYVDTVKLPAMPVVAAGGTPTVPFNYYCGNVVLFATDSLSRPASDSIYWQGAVASGTSTANQVYQRNLTASGTYYFRAKDNNTGCWSQPTRQR